MSFSGCIGSLGSAPAKIAPDRAVVLVELPLRDLNPARATDAVSQKIDNLIHAALVQRGPSTLEPELAESWQISGYRKFHFRLKENLWFHDGSALKAADVVRAFEIFRKKSPLAPAFERVARVWARGDRDVFLETHRPQPFLLSDLPVVKIFKESNGDLIGAGRFRPIRTAINEVEIERFDRYPAQPRPGALKRITFRYVHDETTRYQALIRGDANVLISALSLSKSLYLIANPPKAMKILEARGDNMTYLAMNHRDPRLSNVKVRRAIAHALNVDAILKHRFGRLAYRATGILSPSLTDYYEADVQKYEYDRTKAERLLDDAGYPRGPNGWRFSLTFKTTTEKYGNDIARLLAADLRAVGIDVQLKIMEPATLYADMKAGDFQLYHSRWVGVTNPSIYYRVFHSSQIGALNRGGYRNAEIDRWIDKGMSEPNDKLRREAFSRVQKIAADDLPYINLWYWNVLFVGTNAMENIVLYPNGDFLTLDSITVRQ